jgi:hypothetical protein
LVLAQFAGAQVDDTVGRVEQPRVGIPLLDGGHQSAILARQGNYCGACLGAGDPLALRRLVGGGGDPTA